MIPNVGCLHMSNLSEFISRYVLFCMLSIMLLLTQDKTITIYTTKDQLWSSKAKLHICNVMIGKKVLNFLATL